ncbi:MAG: recombinase family protein, partial [Solirubrobacterales bacterium]
MPQPLKKPGSAKPPRGRVFGQGDPKPRVGLYARVSTHDQQTLPMQLAAMRQYVRKRGWAVALEIEEVASGAKERPE